MGDNEMDDEYEETETDLMELCEDVTMLDMTNNFDQYDDDENDDDNGSFDVADDEEENEYKRNKWEDAANKGYSDEEELAKHTDNVLGGSPFKDKMRSSSLAQNKHITGSKCFNRTYVVRELKPGTSALGYFKHNDENELEYQGKIAIKDKKNKNFTPTKVLQHKSDRNMLLLNESNPGQINILNLDKGKVVEQW